MNLALKLQSRLMQLMQTTFNDWLWQYLFIHFDSQVVNIEPDINPQAELIMWCMKNLFLELVDILRYTFNALISFQLVLTDFFRVPYEFFWSVCKIFMYLQMIQVNFLSDDY